MCKILFQHVINILKWLMRYFAFSFHTKSLKSEEYFIHPAHRSSGSTFPALSSHLRLKCTVLDSAVLCLYLCDGYMGGYVQTHGAEPGRLTFLYANYTSREKEFTPRFLAWTRMDSGWGNLLVWQGLRVNRCGAKWGKSESEDLCPSGLCRSGKVSGHQIRSCAPWWPGSRWQAPVALGS